MLSVHCLRPEWQAATLPLSVIVLVEGPFFFFSEPRTGGGSCRMCEAFGGDWQVAWNRTVQQE